MARATAAGETLSQIDKFFMQRTRRSTVRGHQAALSRYRDHPHDLDARRLLVLFTPSIEVADGLLQHPDTREFLAERLGPTAVAVPEDQIVQLQEVLKKLGIEVVL